MSNSFVRNKFTPALFDAFGRGRVSEPYTLWDSKQLGDNRALFWDDVQVSGGGTTSVYSSAKSSTVIGVAADTAGVRVRQTKQRFNYQPGKSHEIFVTGTLGATGEGITKRVGYFDTRNGVFFQFDSSGLSVVIRSDTSGEVVDRVVPSEEFSFRRNTPLENYFDETKSQIFFFDLEWLGVGSVRDGLATGGAPTYVHQFDHANILAGVYMRTPNLPIRYEIENDGTGAADSLECICSSVISEGGQQQTGTTRGLKTVPTAVAASTGDTTYAVIGIQLKSTHLDNVVTIKKMTMINEANADFLWQILLNPTVEGTFTFGDVANSPIQAAYGVTANTVTGGTRLDCGLSSNDSVASDIAETLLYLGSTVAGVADTIVLTVTPLANNADIQATMTIQFS